MPDSSLDLVRGTVDLLVLRTLAWEPMHGYAIAQFVRGRTSGDRKSTRLNSSH